MGDWTESKYTETRFGGMDHAVEPHTLDRDGGVMSDEFNMVSRTQGLRNRKGWRPQNDLTLYVSSLPGTPKSPLALIPFDVNITTVSEDDDDGDGGDGGNGGVIGGLIDDDDDGGGGGGGSGVSLTLTGPQAVVAEVPFTIASTASGQYRGSNAGLDWAFQSDGTPNVSMSKGIRSGWDDNAWSASAIVLTTDRSRTGVTATLKKGNDVQMSKNMGYSVASMIPSLSSPVPYRQQFNFTISCKLGGATLSGYAGDGRGVAIAWQAFDENEQRVSCHVRHSQVEWANGVGTYHGYLSSVDSTAVKLKAVVTYAGESQTAEAAISGVGLLRVPPALHVFGDGGTMRINGVGLTPSSLSIVAQVDGDAVDLSDYLETTAGTPVTLATGWDENNVWEHDVQAKSSAPAATLTLKLMSGETELASGTITIASALTATIDTDESIKPGETISATATISATGHTITRLPANVVELQILGIDDDVFVDNDDNELELSASYENAASGTYTVQVVDMRDDTVLTSVNVPVEAVKSMLAEAINERIMANTGTAGTYTDEDSASTLRSAAITAITGYAQGAIEPDGTFTAYSSSNHGIPDAADTAEWYASAYAVVKSAVAKTCNPTATQTNQGRRLSGEKDSNVTGSGTSSDPYVLEDKDAFKARVAEEGYDPELDEDECLSEFNGYLHAVEGGTFMDGYSSGSSYAPHHAGVNLSYQCRKYAFTAHVSGTVDMYFTSANNMLTYSTFGHAAPSSAGTTAKCGAFQATAGQASESPWFGGNGANLPPEARQIASRVGYCMTYQRAVIHYNFQHK